MEKGEKDMLIGYARVSSQDQNLTLQIDALTKAGCEKIFEDKVSGTRAERPGLAKAQELMSTGDTLVVWKLDRLGRSIKQLVDLVAGLQKQDVQFKSLTDGFLHPIILNGFYNPFSEATPIKAMLSIQQQRN